MLGPFELRLLISIRNLGDEAYGANIAFNLSKSLEREVAPGQLYLALKRLEEKKYISHSTAAAQPKKGGRRKKIFRLDILGKDTLDELFSAIQ